MTSQSNIEVMSKLEPRYARTRKAGGNRDEKANTIELTIPWSYTREYGLEQPSNVILIPQQDGILIKKVTP